jgi:hypothetical protein
MNYKRDRGIPLASQFGIIVVPQVAEEEQCNATAKTWKGKKLMEQEPVSMRGSSATPLQSCTARWASKVLGTVFEDQNVAER